MYLGYEITNVTFILYDTLKTYLNRWHQFKIHNYNLYILKLNDSNTKMTLK